MSESKEGRSARSFIKRAYDRMRGFAKSIFTFEADKALLNWWAGESAAAKTAFFSALIIGFSTNIFVYSGRFFGDHDFGTVLRANPMIGSGRWLSTIVNQVSYGYVLPLTSGIFVSLFLACAAFLFIKLFNVRNKVSAFTIAGLMATFPSIAVTNLYLYDTPNYHFAVVLAVLAVYLTVRFRMGFFLGALLLMCVLAIYQAKVNVAVALCLFYLIGDLLSRGFNFKRFGGFAARFFAMGLLGGLFYIISLPASYYVSGVQLTGYRGMSSESFSERLFSLEGVSEALSSAYESFILFFTGGLQLASNGLLIAYALLLAVLVLLLTITVVKRKIYQNPFRLLALLVLILLIPLACGFATFFADGPATPLMIYAFVFSVAFVLVIVEGRDYIPGLLKSLALCLCIFLVFNYVVVNNVYYSRAYYYNQQALSLMSRVATEVDPLLPLISSETKPIIFLGNIPSEYYPLILGDVHAPLAGPDAFEGLWKGPPLGENLFFYEASRSQNLFMQKLISLLGVPVSHLSDAAMMETIRESALAADMPAWPAEGSVGIIDDVIVVNFGVIDLGFSQDENGHFFQVRHWISSGHARHDYSYRWRVYQGDVRIEDVTTQDSRFDFNLLDDNSSYRITVTITNVTTGFRYRAVEVEVPVGER